MILDTPHPRARRLHDIGQPTIPVWGICNDNFFVFCVDAISWWSHTTRRDCRLREFQIKAVIRFSEGLGRAFEKPRSPD